MPHLIQVTRTALKDQYLQGPREPKRVRKDGYGFTADKAAAWPFETHKAAAHKARIVERHMSWEPGTLTVIPPPSTPST